MTAPQDERRRALFQQAESLFRQLENLPADEHATFLDSHVTDPELRAFAEELLANDPGEDDAVPIASEFPAIAELGEVRARPERIGPYRILEELGEGGMGIVYVAEQTEPVRRRVALKLIKLGMDSREVVSRFKAERQALAIMDHPEIARIFDAGTTEDGRPYFAMEYVQGSPITSYCQEHRLSLTERLRILRDVCLAIHHAHERGVIHRDLKPSNLLVSRTEDRHLVKVIDFGVARAIEQAPCDRTVQTKLGRVIGTPAYMSPEQAEGSRDLDPRTDVYSIGVILYELLVGVLPIDVSQDVAFDTTLRRIREEDPSTPSSRWAQLGRGETTELASLRGMRATLIESQLRGDLDWIAMKALEKDRERRYRSTALLAEEIDRYLRDDPVLARPPTVSYRVVKFVRKNRAAVTGVSAVFLALLVGLMTSTVLFFQARENLELASRNEEDARSYAAEVEFASVRLLERERRVKRNLHAVQMQLAQKAWTEGHTSTVKQLLEAQLPDVASPDLRGFGWYYLWRLVHSEERTFEGHSDTVFTIALSPDGTILATGSTDRSIRLWEARTGRELTTLLGHSEMVNCVRFSPRGEMLASAGDDGRILLWSLESRQIIAELEGNNGVVQAVDFTPDGRTLASFGEDRSVILWDVQRGEEMDRLEGHDPRYDRLNNMHAWAMAISPDGALLVSVAGHAWDRQIPGEVFLWDLKTRQLLRKIDGHGGAPLSVAFSPNGQQFATAGVDLAVRVWTRAGEPIATLAAHRQPVEALCFSRDNRWLVSGGEDQWIIVWDTETWQKEATLLGHSSTVESLAVSPDGQIYSGSRDGTAKAWSPVPREGFLTIEKCRTGSRTLAFSPDGSRLALTRSDGRLSIWDVESSKELRSRMFADKVHTVAYSHDGSAMAIGLFDGRTLLLDARSLDPRHEFRDHKHWVYDVAISPDGRFLASSGVQHYVIARDCSSGDRLRSVQHRSEVNSVEFSPDSRVLVTGSRDGTCQVLDTREWKRLAILRTDGTDVKFSPDGSKLAVASRSGKVTIWDARTWEILVTCEGHAAATWGVRFSPDGEELFSCSDDGTIRVWDARTGTERFALEGHEDRVRSLDISRDGTRIASVSWDEKLKIWSCAPQSWVESHPRSLSLARDRARRLLMAGEERAAIATLKDASQRAQELFGDESSLRARILLDLVLCCRKTQDLSVLTEAGRQLRIASDILHPRLAGCHPWRIDILELFEDIFGPTALDKPAEISRHHDKVRSVELVSALERATYSVVATPSRSVEEYSTALRRARILCDLVGEDDRRATSLDTLGVALYRAGKYEEALHRFDESRRICRQRSLLDTPINSVFATLCLRELGRRDEAGERVAGLASLLRTHENRSTPDVLEVCLELTNNLSSDSDAITAYALEYTEFCRVLARRLQDRNRHDDAMDVLQIAAAHSKESAITRLDLARLLLSAGRLADARNAINEALSLDPEMSESLTVLAATLFAAGDRRAARGALKKAFGVDKTDFVADRKLDEVLELWKEEGHKHPIVVPNAGFNGNGGASIGNTRGSVPDGWKAFIIGEGETEVEAIPLAREELFPGSRGTNALLFRVLAFGKQEGLQHDDRRVRLFPGLKYRSAFWLKSANRDGSTQRFVCRFLLAKDGKGVPSAPGSLGREAGLVATGEWQQFRGPVFPVADADAGYLSFRPLDDGGENAILIALPAIQVVGRATSQERPRNNSRARGED